MKLEAYPKIDNITRNVVGVYVRHGQGGLTSPHACTMRANCVALLPRETGACGIGACGTRTLRPVLKVE